MAKPFAAPELTALLAQKTAELKALDFDESDIQLRIRDFLEACFVEFQGPIGLAKRMYVEYEAAKAGSQARTRLLDMILRLLEKFDSSGKGSDKTVDDDEVERVEALLTAQANGNANK